QQVLKRFNIAEQDPFQAIDQVINVDHKDLRIVGVIKNFQYGGAGNKSGEEIVFRYSNKNPKWLNVKIQSADPLATYAKIESIWKKNDRVHTFEAKFYDEQIAEN